MLFLTILLFINQICNYGRTNAGSLKKLDLLSDECGQINENRIIGGTTAILYEFPWIALISHITKSGPTFRCTGSIINSRYILTDATCARFVEDSIAGVRVGEYDLRSQIDCQEKDGQTTCERYLQDIESEEIIVHENYTSESGIPDNDIALLRLREEINFNHQNVGTICLPKTYELRNSNIVGRIGTVAGWGNSKRHLLKHDMTIISDTECQNKLPYYFIAPNNYICADTPDKDNDIGDGGGPLMVQNEYEGATKYIQYGIISRGSKTLLLINTDVRKYMDWIIEHLKP